LLKYLDIKKRHRIFVSTKKVIIDKHKLKLNIMTTLQAINFAARVQIGSLIKVRGRILRVDEITDNAFVGQTIYKDKERGKTFLTFDMLLNPHYNKNIEILNA
jgi:hypothetical protein